jgi:filamentous hemagglutinin
MSKFGGSNFASGAAGAGINQLVMNELKNIKDPAVLQWASAIVGAVAAKLVGGDAQTGASVAASATKNNEDGHPVHDMVNSAMFLTLGYVMTTLADGSQAVVNAAGEVVATLSDAGEWVDSAGNAIGDFKDWVYDKYINATFPDSPDDFNPDGLVKNEYPCTKNGKIIKWQDPQTGAGYEWDEDPANGEHYHKLPEGGNGRVPDPDTGNTHYYQGDNVPE